MSNLSIRAAAKVQQFNIKTIAIIFALLDLFLLPVVLDNPVFTKDYFYFIIYQVTIILGLFVGLRGQGRYKAMMIELRSVASNRDFDPDERDAILVPLIHHACLELGISAEKRNEEYGLFKSKKNPTTFAKEKVVKKKTKNFKEEKIMSETKIVIWDLVVWKQFGYMIVGIWGVFSPVIVLILAELSLHWAIILFITGAWVFVDIFILFYIHYIFKIEPVLPERTII